MARKKFTKKTTDGNTDLIYLVCAIVVIVALTLFNISLYLSPSNPKSLKSNVNSVYINYWVSFLDKNPEYLPGWLELAKLEYHNGDKEKAKKALMMAEKINPNSEDVNYYKIIYFLNEN